MSLPDRSELPSQQVDWMATTHWSVVRAAASDDLTLRRAALSKLCTAYWLPLFIYVRRKGYDEHDASDLIQEFFAQLLARNDFSSLEPSQGRFRAFMLAAVNHFLANQWRRSRALKRGAGERPISLDATLCGEHHELMATELSPEQLFDTKWAETTLERAARVLREEFALDGRQHIFRELNQFLSTPAAAGDYTAAAQRLDMSKAAVAKVVERMRRRYRELVRCEIAQTIHSPDELDDEIRYLLSVLTR